MIYPGNGGNCNIKNGAEKLAFLILFAVCVSVFAGGKNVSLKLPEQIITELKREQGYEIFGVEEVEYVDLNEDGRDEVFIYTGGRGASGNGDILLYAKVKNQWKKLNDFFGAFVEIDRRKTKEWRGIFVSYHSSAIYSYVEYYIWDGKKYVKDDEFDIPQHTGEMTGEFTRITHLPIKLGDDFKHIENVFVYLGGEPKKISLKGLRMGETAFEGYYTLNFRKKEDKNRRKKFGRFFFKNSKLFAFSMEAPHFCFWGEKRMVYIGDSSEEYRNYLRRKTRIRLFGEIFELEGNSNVFLKIKKGRISEIIFCSNSKD